MGGDGHDGSSAVAHHDVVGNPDGDFFAVDGVDGVGSGGDSAFVFVEVAALEVGFAGAGFLIRFDCFGLFGRGDVCDQGVLGSENHVGGSEEGVGTGGEDGERAGSSLHVEVDFGSFAATDPVALEGFDGVGPVERF